MLMLLKPWNELRQLKGNQLSFSGAFGEFMLTASECAKHTIENIQYYYECADGAKGKGENDKRTCASVLNVTDDMDTDGGLVEGFTEKNLCKTDFEAAR